VAEVAEEDGMGPAEERAALSEGTRIRDLLYQRTGVIQEVARQYAYPQAPPNFVYLVRWDDGQVQALAEAAFQGGHGLELEDGEP